MEKTGYLIFTEVGFIEAKEVLLSATTTALWINPNILNTAQLNTLKKRESTPISSNNGLNRAMKK